MTKGILGLILLINLQPLLAAEPTTPPSGGNKDELLLFFEEEQLVGIATKHLQKLNQAPAIVSVVTGRDVNANLRATSGTPRIGGDPREAVSGYGVADVAVNARKIYRGLDLRASVYNLFDKNYFDPAPLGSVNSDFPREGRAYMLELAYKM